MWTLAFTSLGQIPKPAVAGLCDRCMFYFMRNCQKVLQSGCTLFCFDEKTKTKNLNKPTKTHWYIENWLWALVNWTMRLVKGRYALPCSSIYFYSGEYLFFVNKEIQGIRNSGSCLAFLKLFKFFLICFKRKGLEKLWANIPSKWAFAPDSL